MNFKNIKSVVMAREAIAKLSVAEQSTTERGGIVVHLRRCMIKGKRSGGIVVCVYGPRSSACSRSPKVYRRIKANASPVTLENAIMRSVSEVCAIARVDVYRDALEKEIDALEVDGDKIDSIVKEYGVTDSYDEMTTGDIIFWRKRLAEITVAP